MWDNSGVLFFSFIESCLLYTQFSFDWLLMLSYYYYQIYMYICRYIYIYICFITTWCFCQLRVHIGGQSKSQSGHLMHGIYVTRLLFFFFRISNWKKKSSQKSLVQKQKAVLFLSGWRGRYEEGAVEHTSEKRCFCSLFPLSSSNSTESFFFFGRLRECCLAIFIFLCAVNYTRKVIITMKTMIIIRQNNKKRMKEKTTTTTLRESMRTVLDQNQMKKKTEEKAVSSAPKKKKANRKEISLVQLHLVQQR